MKLQDLLKDIELGKVYTDKDRQPFKVNEGMKRFKVYVSGESEPLVLLGKNEKDVKQVAHQMIQNSSVRIRKVVKEEKNKGLWYNIHKKRKRGENPAKPGDKDYPKTLDIDEAGFGGVSAAPKYSSPEAKKVVDGALRDYAKDLRKLQYRVVKDWMTKAKSGIIDFFDLVRGFEGGDMSRAHPYETDFLKKVLTRDKIVDRFRKYFGGRKGKRR